MKKLLCLLMLMVSSLSALTYTDGRMVSGMLRLSTNNYYSITNLPVSLVHTNDLVLTRLSVSNHPAGIYQRRATFVFRHELTATNWIHILQNGTLATNSIVISKFSAVSNRITAISNKFANSGAGSTNGIGARISAVSGQTLGYNLRFAVVSGRITAVSNVAYNNKFITNGYGSKFVSVTGQTLGMSLRFINSSNRVTRVSNIAIQGLTTTNGYGTKFSSVTKQTLGYNIRFSTLSTRVSGASNLAYQNKFVTNGFGGKISAVSFQTLGYGIRFVRSSNRITGVSNGAVNTAGLRTMNASNILAIRMAGISNGAVTYTYIKSGIVSNGAVVSAGLRTASASNSLQARIGVASNRAVFWAGERTRAVSNITTIHMVAISNHFDTAINHLISFTNHANYTILSNRITAVSNSLALADAGLGSRIGAVSNKLAVRITSVSNAIKVQTNGFGNRFVSISNRITSVSNAIKVQTNGLGAKFISVSNGAIATAVYTTTNLITKGFITNRGIASTNWVAINRPVTNGLGNIKRFPVDIDRCGFVDNSQTAINLTANLFTLSNKSTSWSFYRSGRKFSVTSNVHAYLVSPTNGFNFIFIDATNGALTISKSPWTLLDSKLPVASVYYSNTRTPKFLLADERHTILIDKRVHYVEHFTVGTLPISYGTLFGMGTTSANVDKTFGITTTTIADEDLVLTLPQHPDGSSTTNNYGILFRDSPTTWKVTNSRVPFLYPPAGNIFYDNNGVLTSIGNNRYCNTYLLACNVQGTFRFVSIQGRSDFPSLITALAESFSSFDLTGIPLIESVALYQLTWTTTGGANLGACHFVSSQKINGNVVTSTVVPTTPHNSLTGLQGGATGEFYHLSFADYTNTRRINANLPEYTISRLAGSWDFPATNPAPLDVIQGTNGTITRYSFDDTLNEGILTTFQMPPDLKIDSRVTFEVYGYPSTAVASRYIKVKLFSSAVSNAMNWDRGWITNTSGIVLTTATNKRLDHIVWTNNTSYLGWHPNDFVRLRLYRVHTVSPQTDLTGDYGIISFRIRMKRYD